MNPPTLDNTIARWARVGVLFGGRPGRRSPDLERLLLDTARLAGDDARLFTLAITWLSQCDGFVARHRLKRLVRDELEPQSQPSLGLLLDLAIEHGASPTLNLVAKQCGSFADPRPLFAVHASSKTRRELARQTACPQAVQRGLWVPDVELKLDALRPAAWIVDHNPAYADRIVRKGDLRASILETLRHDVPGGKLESEQALVELCAANRPAVSAALDDLEREGIRIRRPDPSDRRRNRIQLPVAA